MSKSTWLQVRLTLEQKSELRTRAAAAGQEISGYVVERILGGAAPEFERLLQWMLRTPESHVPYAEFTDYLRTLPAARGAELATQPPSFPRLSRLQQNHVCAAIEQRAQLWSVRPPAWVLDVAALETPHYSGDLLSLRPYLTVVAPLVWRRRGIFTEGGLAARLAVLSPAATPTEAAELSAAFEAGPSRAYRRRVAEGSPAFGDDAPLTRERILSLLAQLDAELAGQGVLAEMLMVGGAVMTLVFQAREQTRDIDAVFEPVAPVREAVVRIAEREALSPDWLNDAVSGFLSTEGRYDPYFEGAGLRVFVARAEYLLAMKILAQRPAEQSRDFDDIRFLCRYLNITTLVAALDVVERYYPVTRLEPRHRFGIEELLQEMLKQPERE